MGSSDKLIAILLAITALFYSASGIALYFFPAQTFESMPGYYGSFNLHFVKDAGLAFLSCGLMLGLALFNRERRMIYTFCASLFVLFHALFHLQMLIGGMVPSEYFSYELLQIFLPALVLLTVLLLIYAREKTLG